jgi:hypothetical protein
MSFVTAGTAISAQHFTTCNVIRSAGKNTALVIDLFGGGNPGSLNGSSVDPGGVETVPAVILPAANCGPPPAANYQHGVIHENGYLPSYRPHPSRCARLSCGDHCRWRLRTEVPLPWLIRRMQRSSRCATV